MACIRLTHVLHLYERLFNTKNNRWVVSVSALKQGYTHDVPHTRTRTKIWVEARATEEGEEAGAGTARPTTSCGCAQKNLGGMARAFVDASEGSTMDRNYRKKDQKWQMVRRRDASGGKRTRFGSVLCSCTAVVVRISIVYEVPGREYDTFACFRVRAFTIDTAQRTNGRESHSPSFSLSLSLEGYSEVHRRVHEPASGLGTYEAHDRV